MFNKFCFTLLLAVFFAISALSTAAQRPRAVADDTPAPVTTPPPEPPPTVKAKYEGGILGFPKKQTGTLTIDSANNRLVFSDKGKEIFHIPFGSITGAYADSRSVRPTAATVVSHIPYGFPAGWIKTKIRYLTLQYDDPDNKAAGVTSFRLDNKEILDSVLYSVATKAGLTKRGEGYVRKKT